MELRRATVKDAALFRQLVERLHAHMVSVANDPTLQDNATWFLPAYETWFEMSVHWNKGVVVIAEDPEPVGFAAGDIRQTEFGSAETPNVGVLALLWVEPSHRRKGVAKKLIAAVEQWLLDKRMPYVEIPYTVGTPGASELFHSSGYTDYRVVSRKKLAR